MSSEEVEKTALSGGETEKKSDDINRVAYTQNSIFLDAL